MAAKNRKRRRYRGHPARAAQLKRPPDARELEVRELLRLVRREASNPQEGPLVGPLAAAARRVAVLICERAEGLEGPEHRHAVANYLTERLGAVIDGFDARDYRRWRETTALRLAVAEHATRAPRGRISWHECRRPQRGIPPFRSTRRRSGWYAGEIARSRRRSSSNSTERYSTGTGIRRPPRCLRKATCFALSRIAYCTERRGSSRTCTRA